MAGNSAWILAWILGVKSDSFHAQARTEEYAVKAACGPRGEQGRWLFLTQLHTGAQRKMPAIAGEGAWRGGVGREASPTQLRSPMQRKYVAEAAHGACGE